MDNTGVADPLLQAMSFLALQNPNMEVLKICDIPVQFA